MLPMGPTGKLGPVSPMGSFRTFARHSPALPPPMAVEDHGRAGKEAGRRSNVSAPAHPRLYHRILCGQFQ